MIKYRSEISKLQRVVIKVGSESVTFSTGGCDSQKIKTITDDIANLCKNGIEVILVSSGAINTGTTLIKNPDRSRIEMLQACSAIGQPILMNEYQRAFHHHELRAAQILLTHEDFKSRTRYLNARNTIHTLIHEKFIPILNENDTVSFEEITVGDNDQLAAMTAELVNADLLILLTKTDGLFDRDPSHQQATPIKHVFYGEKLHVDVSGKTNAGRGGMAAKLEAVKKSTFVGVPVLIASYDKPQPILRAITSSNGTYFEHNPKAKLGDRRSWLLSIMKPKSRIHIDRGAYEALSGRNASLLPSGVKLVEGPFRRGDSVAIAFQRKTIGVGLAEYDARDVRKIAGAKSDMIAEILGACPSPVIIHRDNLMLGTP